MFETIEEARLALESICKAIKEMCKKKGCSCLLYGVVSVSGKNTTKRTRYGSVYSKTIKKELAPHIHVIYLIEKHSVMTHDIREYLKDSFGEKFFFNAIEDPEYLQNRIRYCVWQCQKYRTVNTCTEDFAKRYAGDFVSLLEKENKAWGNGKLVFKKYKNMTLGSDPSVFDFSYKAKQRREEKVEVLTDIMVNQTVSPFTKDLENAPFWAEKEGKQGDFGAISASLNPRDPLPEQCCVIYNNIPVLTNHTYAS